MELEHAGTFSNSIGAEALPMQGQKKYHKVYSLSEYLHNTNIIISAIIFLNYKWRSAICNHHQNKYTSHYEKELFEIN